MGDKQYRGRHVSTVGDTKVPWVTLKLFLEKYRGRHVGTVGDMWGTVDNTLGTVGNILTTVGDMGVSTVGDII